ncbi:MAG: PQQ-binding-like beta-propeller repeat protein [Bacteroidetes bacterium]|nr:PQQ-binding-like beta-propeller repeat protein [Bacteroidota bacterium]
MQELEKSGESKLQKPLRLLPGIIIVALQWVIRFVIPMIAPHFLIYSIFAGLLGGLGVAIWWAFFSRAAVFERWSALLLVIGCLYGTSFFLDKSIATANVGLMFTIFSIPVMSLAFVSWAVATRRFSTIIRRVSLVFTAIVASGSWILLRTNGMDAELHHQFDWRWAKTHEERLLAEPVKESFETIPATTGFQSGFEWPGFRGINRDGIVHGAKLNADWSLSPPVNLWRREVGPGCSSMAINGHVFYTQEQLGEDEIVSCYDLENGKPIWKHRDKARFYDSHAGAGPRSTPTLLGNRIYTLGGTGILNALDAVNGKLLWSRNAAADAGIKALPWGFTSSPLIFNGLAIVALSGKLAAYDTLDGKPRWFGPDMGNSYSSPQLFTLNGVPQVLLMASKGAISIDPGSGKKLWDYPWATEDRILQPANLGNGDLLLSRESNEVRRVSIIRENNIWKVKEKWTSPEMNASFNDCVIHKGYAYGFDGPFLACLDLKNGKRMWKGGHYQGWLLLLADQDMILVLTEIGDLALVKATPDSFIELSKVTAIKGRTWNHPAMAGNILLVRNAEQMAAFRLSKSSN